MLPSRFALNAFFSENPTFPVTLPADRARTFHQSLPFYRPTPLIARPALAAQLGIKNIFVKDESQRFGLKAFKVIGALYAIYRFLDQRRLKDDGESLKSSDLFSKQARRRLHDDVLTTATDGNHGRAVAWVAKRLGLRAVIFVPENMADVRRKAIEKEGARIVVVHGHYDAAVEAMAQQAQQHGWHIISDTAWPGYEEIPQWIMTGYQTIFFEIDEEMSDKPDFVFIQAGVGGLAAAAADYFVKKHRSAVPELVCVEPLDADCLLESIVAGGGETAAAKGRQNSIMSGLNCGTPSSLAWPFVKHSFRAFLAIDDGWAGQAMRALYNPAASEKSIVSGESGAAGLAGLMALLQEDGLQEARKKLGLNEQSTVLVINTEGDTDPENFARIVG